jgi:hypothetical protein
MESHLERSTSRWRIAGGILRCGTTWLGISTLAADKGNIVIETRILPVFRRYSGIVGSSIIELRRECDLEKNKSASFISPETTSAKGVGTIMHILDRPGPANTATVIDIVKEAAPRADAIVVASITGDSVLEIADGAGDTKVVCVTCPQGMAWELDGMETGVFSDIPELRALRDEWKTEGRVRVPMEIAPETRARLEERGVTVIRGTIPLFGPSFSMRVHLGHISSLDIMAKTLELFSPGTLVGMECVLMAVDAGAVSEGVPVCCCAGTERGLDTAWIVRSSSSANLFHPERGFRFIELLVKPGIAVNPPVGIGYIR